jgi:amino acid transporter
MLFVFIPLAVVLLGVIIYFALSKNSPRTVRFAALIALGSVILSVLVCGFIVFMNLREGGGEPAIPDYLVPGSAPPPAKNNLFALVILAVFLLGVLGLVVFLSFREQRKAAAKAQEDDSSEEGYSS